MPSDKLSLVFHALSHPTRRAILSMLVLGPLPVGEIAKPFAMTEPGVIRHLKVLEKAGLIQTNKSGQLRPRMLNAIPLAEAYRWVDQYREVWEANYDRLDDYLQQLQSGENT